MDRPPPPESRPELLPPLGEDLVGRGDDEEGEESRGAAKMLP
jgi:hypothetical protein